MRGVVGVCSGLTPGADLAVGLSQTLSLRATLPPGVLWGRLRLGLREDEAIGFRGVCGMKRPEYREAGKIGSCENCSAWKEVGARRGVWGARVFMLLFAPECPPSALEKTRQFMVHAQLEWGALMRQRASNTHAPPKPPGAWRPSPRALQFCTRRP